MRPEPAIATRPSGGAERLLRLEGEARAAPSVAELAFLMANETPALTGAAQIFVFRKKGRRFQIEAATSVGLVEQDAPQIRWLNAVLKNLSREAGLDEPREFTLPAYSPPGAAEADEHPFPSFLWAPLKLRSGAVFGGMLLTRNSLWSEAEVMIASRLAGTYQHAWRALTGEGRLKRRPLRGVVALCTLAALIAAGAWPVPMTVIAPAEIRSSNAHIIAAPLDGAIDEVLAEPNETVAKGALLLRFADTELRSSLAVAEEELSVASARLKQVNQRSFADAEARAELEIARTETSLARARRDYAAGLLERAEVRAPEPGVVILPDKQELTGRPVRTGERIMEIADPGAVQLRIDVPVADVLMIREGAKVRAFLDSDPLRPLDAHVTAASFEARLVSDQTLAYRIYADFDDAEARPRLGVRGSAQIFGDEAPLAFFLFRRPLSAMRQWLGL